MKCDDKVSNSAHSRQFSWYPQLPACTCSMASGFSQIPKWESDATSHSTIVNPVTVSHDRTQPLTTANFSTVFHDSVRPPSKNSGHCLENDAGSQLEDDNNNKMEDDNNDIMAVIFINFNHHVPKTYLLFSDFLQ